MRLQLLLSIALSVSMLAACADEVITVSCDQSNHPLLASCEEHTLPRSQLGYREDSCAVLGGSWAEDTCPGGSLGGCLISSGDVDWVVYYYRGDLHGDEASIMESCALSGREYVAP